MTDSTQPDSTQPAVSVWLTGQHPSRDLRRHRYTRESMAHPGKMLPTIARHAIGTYTQPGDLVLDPMAGIGTTLVEAMHLGRHGIGVEYEQQWAHHTTANLRLAAAHGATGTGEIHIGDSRTLTSVLPRRLRGQVALVITSPPYGSSTHGHARTPGPRNGKVRKVNHSYGGTDNLAYRSHDDLADGFTNILTGCAALLRPGGHIVVTARPYRHHGELVDIPGMVVAAGNHAGLHLIEECVALIAGIRNGQLVPRSSLFQHRNITTADAAGDPQWLVQHEDLLIFQAQSDGTITGGHARQPERPDPNHNGSRHSLDLFTRRRMDRRPQPAHPAHPDGNAGRQSEQDRVAERTPDPCPPNSHPEHEQPEPHDTASPATLCPAGQSVPQAHSPAGGR